MYLLHINPLILPLNKVHVLHIHVHVYIINFQMLKNKL